MLFISVDHRPVIVSPASKAVCLSMESWLGAPIQRTATVVGGDGGVRVRECSVSVVGHITTYEIISYKCII